VVSRQSERFGQRGRMHYSLVLSVRSVRCVELSKMPEQCILPSVPDVILVGVHTFSDSNAVRMVDVDVILVGVHTFSDSNAVRMVDVASC
jgi:hypothetical protein